MHVVTGKVITLKTLQMEQSFESKGRKMGENEPGSVEFTNVEAYLSKIKSSSTRS